jgi:hypothetical protein
VSSSREGDRTAGSVRAVVDVVGVAPLAWGAAALVFAAAGVAAALAVTRYAELDEEHLRIAATSLAGLFCGAAAVSGLRLLEEGGSARQAVGTILCLVAAATFVLAAIAIWRDDLYDGEPWNFWRALVTGLALTLSGLVLAPLSLLTDLGSRAVRAAFVATALATGTAAAVGIAALWRWDPDGTTRTTSRDLVLRVVIAFFALGVAAMLATVAVDRSVRRRPRPVGPRPDASSL